MNKQIEPLKEWLYAQAIPMREAALQRAPNLLPDASAVDEFLAVLTAGVNEDAATQLAAVQTWALSSIGDDPLLANDWLTLLRVLKEGLGQRLNQHFAADQVLHRWSALDPLFNHAFVETARLASEPDRATHLQYMVDLRSQMERFNRSKSKFVAVAAHELKTPLTLLEGYTDIIRAAIPEEETRLHTYLAGLSEGTRRLRLIIEDMLDVAILDIQSLDLRYQPMYLSKLVVMVANDIVERFHERRVQLDVEPLVVDRAIYGDPERLFQAFTKVVENAVKYTPDGGRVTISSALTRQDERTANIDGYIDIQVADTGIGIDPDELTTVFDKFATIHDVSLHSSGKTKFKGGGMGMGLPIARGIIEAHGGRVWVESPGYDEKTCPGSTFHLELPIRLKPPDE